MNIESRRVGKPSNIERSGPGPQGTQPLDRLDPRPSIGQLAALACLFEATAPKPGNVHRGADFEDLTYLDFTVSAVMIAPSMDAAAAGERLGRVVLSAVQATRAAVATNTNLGTVLLLAPLCMVPRGSDLAKGVREVLDGLDAEDARLVYEAIRLAQPGGLGQVAEADVAGPPPTDLLAAMRLAADRDSVARQYANGFADVLVRAVPWLAAALQRGWRLPDAIVHLQLRLMSELPDSLIARKCGDALARRAGDQASTVLEAGQPGDDAYHQALADFDFWLRSDHNHRNPGTTADLVAAALFVALREGIIGPPYRHF